MRPSFPRALLSGAFALSTILVAPGCAKNSQAAAVPPLRVAMVIDTSPLADPALNASAVAGVEATKTLLGAETNVLSAGSHAEYQADLTLLVDQDYDEVFAVGAETAGDVTIVARRYPRRTFGLVDGIAHEPNIASIVFRTREAAFLAGALASAIAGAREPLVATGGTGPRAAALRDAFIAGVRYARANASPHARDATSVRPLSRDAGAGAAGALAEPAGTLYDANGTPTFTTTAGRVPGRVLARVVKRADVAVLLIAEDARSEKLPGGPAPFGLAQRSVELGLTPRARALAGARGLAMLARLRDAIASGTIAP